MLGLIKRGDLPRPEAACMVDTNRERSSTWRYVDAVIRPELAALGVPFTVIDRSRYATKDLLGGEDGESVLLPLYTNQIGESKLPEFCSGEWKREVVVRWARQQPGWFERGVDCWLGITHEERHRRGKRPRLQWFQPSYPLLDRCPSHVSRVYDLCQEFGWPDPVRSCCWMCPNMRNAEWRDLRDTSPGEFAQACDLDDWARTVDPCGFVHNSRVPLRMADLDTPEPPGLFGGGCSSGMCY
jgi:hypothetical protein